MHRSPNILNYMPLCMLLYIVITVVAVAIASAQGLRITGEVPEGYKPDVVIFNLTDGGAGKISVAVNEALAFLSHNTNACEVHILENRAAIRCVTSNGIQYKLSITPDDPSCLYDSVYRIPCDVVGAHDLLQVAVSVVKRITGDTNPLMVVWAGHAGDDGCVYMAGGGQVCIGELAVMSSLLSPAAVVFDFCDSAVGIPIAKAILANSDTLWGVFVNDEIPSYGLEPLYAKGVEWLLNSLAESRYDMLFQALNEFYSADISRRYDRYVQYYCPWSTGRFMKPFGVTICFINGMCKSWYALLACPRR